VGRIEEVFQRVKERYVEAFQDNVPPSPPQPLTTADAVLIPDPSGFPIPVRGEPGFRDPSRANEEAELGEPGDIPERLKENGWEAVAWYLPFHLNEREWGVYIDWYRFKQLASHIRHKTGATAHRVLGAVYDELVAHELFHCRTEIFAALVEDLRRFAFYLPYNELYGKIRLKDNCVEESLATSYGLAQVKDKTIRNELERLSDTMSGGYKQWRSYRYSPASIASGEWWEGVDKLTGQIIETDAAHVWSQSVHLLSKKALVEIPRYVWSTPAEAKNIPDDILAYLVQHEDFIGCLKKVRPDLRIELINKGRGKHPWKLAINGKEIPYKPSWDGAPPFIFNQVAEVMGMKSTELRKQVHTYIS
jgi:hypothetical protein